MKRQSMYLTSFMALIAVVLIIAMWPHAALAQSGFDCPYTVQSGDSLIGIANRYGVKNYRDIVSASGLSNDVIHPGDVLNVPCLNAVPSPTPTQVSVAPVANPQNTPVSEPPQDCAGCTQAPLKVEWIDQDDLTMVVNGAVIGLDAAAVFVLVNADSPFLPFGDAVAAGYVNVRYGVNAWRAFKVIAIGTVVVGPVVLSVAPGTSAVQPTAAATPLTPEQALELESKRVLTKEEQEAIQEKAREADKEPTGCMRGVLQGELDGYAHITPNMTKLQMAEVRIAIASVAYQIAYYDVDGNQQLPYGEGTVAEVNIYVSTGHMTLIFACSQGVWIPGGASFTRTSPPMAGVSQPTPVPPTATPVPVPPTATPIPSKPAPIIATPTTAGCGALVVDGTQIVASASHGQHADQKDANGQVLFRWWCKNGTWIK